MGEEEWKVSDLLDDEQPLVNDTKLAKQIVDVLSSISNIEHNIRVPKAAVEFAENTLSEWFEIIAEIEKKRGNIPYLINRTLYAPNSEGAPDWDQGLRLSDWNQWLNDIHFMDGFREHYHLTKMYKSTSGEEPLSGYYNRIFPVKFVLRVLAALSLIGTHEISHGNEEWQVDSEQITLEKLRTNALDHALYARSYLEEVDRKSNSPRKVAGEIAVGFPESNDKAKERFVAQFVCSKRKKQLSGALIDMGFANMPKYFTMISDEIHFTPYGLQFALMPNPILDTGGEGWINYVKTGKRFSDDEIQFLLMHFKKNVPAEWELMTRIARSIDEGCNRPKSLEQDLLVMYGWEKTKMSQMRNGAVSRMEELGLINRQKEGREVTYSITDLCKSNLLDMN